MADFLNVKTINSDDDFDILDEDEDIDEKDKVSAIFLIINEYLNSQGFIKLREVKEFLRAVSYTHLTLPTILLV